MRNFVEGISEYAKDKDSNFIIITQNEIELITKNVEPDGELAVDYINAIDGVGQEDLFYGYEDDNKPTPKNVSDYLNSFLQRVKNEGKKVLVTDYCWDKSKIDDSYQKNYSLGYISIATCRDLSCIPTYPPKPYNENDKDIENLNEAQNFLYLINPENFDAKEDLGEAEDYRYYWKDEWKNNPPKWLEDENPDWEGNYKVKYWMKDWQNIIYGNSDSYLDKILSVGFDGVYLDIIDAFEYFENKE